jgi:hypothetical protein
MASLFNQPIGIRRYIHEQVILSTEWIVYHNLNKDVIVSDIFVEDEGAITKIIPLEVFPLDNNTLAIQWSSPRVGTIRVG